MEFYLISVLLLLGTTCSFNTSYSKLTHHGRSSCAVTLSQLGNKYKVDKMDRFHNFQTLYCEIFRSIRQTKLNMLEIGFGCGHHVHGRSALLWKEFFPLLSYYTVDYIDETVREKNLACFNDFTKQHPNVVEKIWWGDQIDKGFLQKIVAEYNSTFDIIIDDGAHGYEEQRESFLTLWPILADGGVYVVEDLGADTGFSKLVAQWIEELAHGRHRQSMLTKTANEVNLPKQTKMIGCAFQICFIKKFNFANEVSPINVHNLPARWQRINQKAIV